MSSGDPKALSVVETALQREIRVDCYVRSSLSTAVASRVTTLVERLRTLSERGVVADVRVDQWPLNGSIADESRRTRDELVDAFEQWAAQHGYSLEPAFRRRITPPSPLGLEGEPRERTRVPLVALAFYEADTDAERLRGVVPCTDDSRPDTGRTYTVDQWLTAVERTLLDTAPNEPGTGQTTPLEGQ
ncbi:HTH domain-containing protein [Natrinema longum]|uniref:Uncharacterized protein n=1 Tax=Natrinema longum TaxID=370324 RepID=A0A8A2UDN1_9EURY|nr:HTH domain-containing protein [Natrinema longum]MBZ6495447.1 hypothetical protein [Natrinema longum]QSW86582.1 hypothetical protein J0X27_07135 [Natrinema longum]